MALIKIILSDYFIYTCFDRLIIIIYKYYYLVEHFKYSKLLIISITILNQKILCYHTNLTFN